ncbi:FBD-associated F-box protein At5g38590-like [Solanum verrucosum]|uniref:FBD-associated F-box protein At5g38590-like n=1 Tax=Solanum verrucosum TaxID=315347 RepID=UPI0020CFEA42|nr:FBD-associated F-box protein At5g38590-like [Solanum verrucosum]
MGKRQQLSINFALKKCPCTQEDRISQLPDDILVYILSFLTIKEATYTSLLSKRWLPVWKYIPRLDFDATEPLHQVFLNHKLRKMHMKKYVRWVNRTLHKCEVHRLDQFRVCFDLNKFSQHEIDKWLEFAFARQVQRLELDLLKGGKETRDFDYCYTFPAQLLGLNDKLPALWHNFMSVKVLLLKSVNVTGEVLEFFLHNCPFLEEMVVHGSGTLVNLQVIGPSLKLKHLEIWRCQCLESLKIHDTNLVTLVASAATKLFLSNAPMLIKVEIVGAFRPILKDILAPISCVLSQLEVLKITSSDGLGNYKFPEFTKLKKFVAHVFAWRDTSLLGCTHVIGAAPLLEEFELKLVWYGGMAAEWNYDSGISLTPAECFIGKSIPGLKVPLDSNLVWFKPLRVKRECKKMVSCPLRHLKVIRLCGYFGRTCEFELVKYFLENAIVLEKIIIDPRSQIVTPVLSLSTIEMEQMSRNFAKLQLEGEVPPRIELVIL